MTIILPKNRGIQVNVVVHDNAVVMQFDRPVRDMLMTAQSAAELARALAEATQMIQRKSPPVLKGFEE